MLHHTRTNKSSNLRRVGSLTIKDYPINTKPMATAVLEVTTGEMKLGLATPLIPGSRVELKLDSGEVVAGNVRYCRQVDEDEFHIGVKRVGVDEVMERRKEPRYPATGRASIRFFRETGTVECLSTICDVSKGGMGLSVKEAILPGTAVELTFDGSTVTGIVRNCHPRFNGFRIGIALTAVERRQKARLLATPLRETLDRSRAWISRILRTWTPNPIK